MLFRLYGYWDYVYNGVYAILTDLKHMYNIHHIDNWERDNVAFIGADNIKSSFREWKI